jgi:exodeoxyribonuclease VII small subunit
MSKKDTAGKTAGRKEPSFEQALARIEKIVERLEEGELSLDESLRLFQEGVELSRRCQAVLDEAQRKIELLVRAADGSLQTEAIVPAEGEPGEDEREGDEPSGSPA